MPRQSKVKQAQMNTAIRALFLLYRRGKWENLEELGLSRAEYQERLDSIAVDLGTVPTDEEIAQLKVACPFLVNATGSMLVLLAILTRK